jgi:hypothetical protein
MLDVDFLSKIGLFKHRSDSCRKTLEKHSRMLDCSAGILCFRPEQTGREIFFWRRVPFALSGPMAIEG